MTAGGVEEATMGAAKPLNVEYPSASLTAAADATMVAGSSLATNEPIAPTVG